MAEHLISPGEDPDADYTVPHPYVEPETVEQLQSPADPPVVPIVRCSVCGVSKVPGSPDLQPAAATARHPWHIHDWVDESGSE